MKAKKTISVALAGLLCAGALTGSLAGCNKKKISGANALEVYACSLGYGHEFLTKALEAFAQKEYVKNKYPNFEYSLTTNDEYEFGQAQVLSGATSLDLVFTSSFSPSTVEATGKNGKKSILEDLTDVFESKVMDFNTGKNETDENGNEWTYAEKLEKGTPGILDYLAFEEENGDDVETHYYYTGGGAGVYGILYNKTKLVEYGYLTEDANGNIKGLPRTTKEMKAFAVKIANGGHVPFISSKGTGYWSRVQNLWWAQYEGAEAFDRYFQGQYQNDEGDWVQGVEVLSRAKGRYIANQTTESYLKYDNEPRLIYDESAALDFTTAQSYLISGKGLMQANGTWFDQEMKTLEGQEGADAEIRLMPDLMISEIIDVVPNKSIADDAELSALVGAIASGSTEIKGTFEGVAYDVTQADFDRVKEAHNLFNTGESLSPTIIPSYSDAIPLAKDFLRYLATDEYCRQYLETTSGNSPAFYYDVEKKAPELFATFSPMQKDRLTQIQGKSAILKYKTVNYPLVYRTGYSSFGSGFEIKYFAKNAKDRMSAKDCIDNQIAQYTANNNELWNLMLSQAGLK